MMNKMGKYIDESDGRVYIQGQCIGFGILEKGTQKVHMTHSVDGKLLESRKILNLDK
jgi:hypothetical protein